MIYAGFQHLGLTQILSGVFVIVVTLIFVLTVGCMNRRIFVPLLFAFCLKLMLLIVNYFVFTLPDSGKGSDVGGFLSFSTRSALNGFSSIIGNYPGFSSSEFHAWLVSWWYLLFGDSAFLFGSLALLSATISVFLFWQLYSIIWGRNANTASLWLVAIMPSISLYSVIPRYEAFIWPFILIGIIGVCKWSNQKNLKNVFITTFGFVVAGMFHSPFYLALVVFIGIIAAQQLRKFFIGIKIKKFYVSGFLFSIVFALFFVWFVFGSLHIPKIGTFDSIINNNVEGKYISATAFRGGASYPAWTNISAFSDYFWKPIIRGFYFMFSPFPWDIRSVSHVIGFLDALIYVYVCYVIWSNRTKLISISCFPYVLILLFTLAIIYGMGVGNFGTGIRHRTKFFFIIIALLPPYCFQKIRLRPKSQAHRIYMTASV